MDPERSKSATEGEPSSLGGHALESRRSPGAYVGNVAFYPGPRRGENYRNKYASLFDHSKIDLRHNAEQAHEMNFGQWVEMSRDGGPWDYECDPWMQEGVRQRLYTQKLLVGFRRFHLGFTSSALGLLIESIMEAMRHLGIDATDKSFQADYGLGLGSYWHSDPRDMPRNDPWFQPSGSPASRIVQRRQE